MARSPKINIADIVDELRRNDIELDISTGMLIARAKEKPPQRIIWMLDTHKFEIQAFLWKEKYKLPEIRTCSFLIGPRAKFCRWCGASRLEHYQKLEHPLK